MNTYVEIDMTPRTVVDFENCQRIEHKNAVPTPFGSARARECWAAARKLALYGDAASQLPNVMTLGERAYVLAVWDTIPSGSSCWMTAFWRIEKGLYQEISK